MKVFIETFGCQVNEYDSERIQYFLDKEGYKETKIIEDSDIIILNTCAVRENASNKLYGHIGSLKKLKEKKPGLLICIGGCTAQSLKEKLLNDFPIIDIVFGTHNISGLPGLIKRKYSGNRRICSVPEEGFDYDLDKSKRTSRFTACIPITIGCNNFCSYCIVPYVRGKEISIEPGKIISNIKGLIADGVIEITLLGQNVNSYGQDMDGSIDFAGLLGEAADIPGLMRLKFMTSHPKDFSGKIIDTIKTRNNIANHIHLPLQAGSNKILKAMNRKYTKEDYLKTIDMIRKELPDSSITTDIIVGFPGEDKEDFQETIDIIKKIRFNRAFTFIYSPRIGTTAAGIKDSLSPDKKKEFFSELLETQNKISGEINWGFIGKKFKVMVESKSTKKASFLRGRLGNNTLVNFNGPDSLYGKIITVKITGAKNFYLMGEIAE